MDYQLILRKLRQRIFDYTDNKSVKANRILLKVKEKHLKSLPKVNNDYHWMYACE